MEQIIRTKSHHDSRRDLKTISNIHKNILLTDYTKEYFPAFLLGIYPLLKTDNYLEHDNTIIRDLINNVKISYNLYNTAENCYYIKNITEDKISATNELDYMLKFESNHDIPVTTTPGKAKGYLDTFYHIRNNSTWLIQLRNKLLIISRNTIILGENDKYYPILIPVIKNKDIYKFKYDYLLKEKTNQSLIEYWFDEKNLKIIKNKEYRNRVYSWIEGLKKINSKVISKTINIYDLFIDFEKLNTTKNLSDIQEEKEYLIKKLKII